MSATSFSWEPAFLVLCAAAAIAYVRAGGRSWLFWLGLLLIAVPLDSPLETIAAHRLLMIHLLQNALIADIAPLFVLLGMTPAMRGLVRIRARYALPLWLLSWYGTHLATFYDWALRTGWALQLEHAILVAAGLAFWWPLVARRLSTPASLGYLGIAFVGSSFLGLAFIFSSTPLYSFYEHTPRLWGLSPVRDQNLGGILMNAEQTLVFLLAIGYFVWRLLEEEHVSGAGGSPAARRSVDSGRS